MSRNILRALRSFTTRRPVLSLGTCCTGTVLSRKYTSLPRHVSQCFPLSASAKSRVGVISHHLGTYNCEKHFTSMGALQSKSSIGKKNGKSGKEEMIEAVVCQESDLKENEMKAFELAEEKVLVVRQGGKFYALGNKCTHYNAPLNTGCLGEGRVRCPWHGACFNIATGDIEDFPGLDSLPCFQVEVQPDGGVKVQAKKSELASSRRVKKAVCKDKNDTRTFLVVGGGPAAQVCAETLRQEGFCGNLIMVSKEKVLPYDRVKLSKLLNADPANLALRPEDFYKSSGIDLKLGCELLKLNSEEKKALLSPGEWITYDSIFLATGSKARTLQAPGCDLKNIFVLRTITQANEIAKEVSNDKNVVVVGSSFIGMECAAYCINKAKSVTVVGRGSVPFEPVLGKQIGERIMKMFTDKGVVFHMNADIVAFHPSETDASCVGHLELSSGNIPADIVIAGIGAVPETDYLDGSGVNTSKGGYIPVDEFLTTNVPNVFAGGDLAFAPVMGTNASIGHWQLAQYHGRIAAMNMLGNKKPINTVPFFWTMFLGKGIRYAGYAPRFDDVILHGSLEEMKFIAYFCKDDAVLAIATCGSDPVAAQFAECLSRGGTISKKSVQEDPLGWSKKK